MKPWLCYDELADFFTNVFELRCEQGKIEALERSLEKLDEWSLMRPQSMYDIEIDVTRHVLSAVVKEEKARLGMTSTSDDRDLFTYFAFAIVKFSVLLPYYVRNGKKLIRQPEAKTRSTKAISDELNIPSWLIVCRNEICHKPTVSMSRLRQATYVTLNWLRDNFWLPLLEDECPDKNEPLINCRRELIIYSSIQRLKLLKKTNRPSQMKLIYTYFSADLICCFKLLALQLIKTTPYEMTLEDPFSVSTFNDITNFEHLFNLLNGKFSVQYLLESLTTFFKSNDLKRRHTALFWFAGILFAIDCILQNIQDNQLTSLLMARGSHEIQPVDIVSLRLFYKVANTKSLYSMKLVAILRRLLPSPNYDATFKSYYALNRFIDIREVDARKRFRSNNDNHNSNKIMETEPRTFSVSDRRDEFIKVNGKSSDDKEVNQVIDSIMIDLTDEI